MSVTLGDANRLDARGAWRGPRRRGAGHPALPDGAQRTASGASPGAPDALIVPQPWFEQRFRQVSLYFFDPTARILVPEPVFVPRGEQQATTLVKALLQGPGAGMGQVERSFIPPGLDVGLSVPVSADGRRRHRAARATPASRRRRRSS